MLHSGTFESTADRVVHDVTEIRDTIKPNNWRPIVIYRKSTIPIKKKQADCHPIIIFH